MTYDVNDVYPAIQGEGCLSGTAMVLVRLQGCGVGCPWCDTKETWDRAAAHRADTLADALGTHPGWCRASAAEIAEAARGMAPAVRWALVTGGEPAEQDLAELVAALKTQGFQTAIETSGTATGHLAAGFDWVCCSPKIAMPGGKPILPEVIASADEIKMVVGKAADLATLQELLSTCPLKPQAQVCLQPLSLHPKATALCQETVMSQGWRLSLQTHRMLGLR